MRRVESYACGEWYVGSGQGAELKNAVNGELIGIADSSGLDFSAMLHFGRQTGGAALRDLTIHQRAALLKALGKHLLVQKEKFYAESAWTGATRADGWVDIEGGIGTMLSYSSIARRAV